MKYFFWILKCFAVFLILDALLALIFGNKYMLLGLEYTPGFYRSFIERLSKLPPVILLLIKLAEGIIGFLILLNITKR